MYIAERPVGSGHPTFIIAEVAQAHDGSLGNAHAYIDAVADAGADAIKFQTHIAAAESTPGEAFRIKFSRQDDTRYGYWKRMEFTRSQWEGLAEHARSRGLVFLSSPFSHEAVELLDDVGMAAWKVGSGEVTNLPLLRRMAATGKPVLISSGMASWQDLEQAVAVVTTGGSEVALFQCTTSYPCPPEKIGLNVLGELRARFPGTAVGLSDHSARVEAGLAAVSLGADMVEVHVVFSRECFGPDTSSSLTTGELARLVDGARFIERVLAHPVDKEATAVALHDLKVLFGKSVVLRHARPSGHVLAAGDLTCKKPGTGIPAAELERVVGRSLRGALASDHILTEDDLV